MRRPEVRSPLPQKARIDRLAAFVAPSLQPSSFMEPPAVVAAGRRLPARRRWPRRPGILQQCLLRVAPLWRLKHAQRTAAMLYRKRKTRRVAA